VGSWVANAGVRGEGDDVARVTDRSRRASKGGSARSAFERDGASGWMVAKNRGCDESVLA